MEKTFLQQIEPFLPAGNPDEATTVFVNKTNATTTFLSLDEIFDKGLDTREFNRVTSTKRAGLIKFITGGEEETLSKDEIDQIKEFTKVVLQLGSSVKELANKAAFDKEKMPVQVKYGKLKKKSNRTQEEETKFQELDQELTDIYTKYGKTRPVKQDN
nr:hypothetical protein [uncultured Draconibacterium sp.]